MSKLNECKFRTKLMTKRPETYWVYLENDGKVLEIRDFYFGMNKPNLPDVLDFIGSEYNLYLASPTLEDYRANRGDVEDIEQDYNFLKECVNNYLDFFGKEDLEKLIYWGEYTDQILIVDEVCSFIKECYGKHDLSVEECFKIREDVCSIWGSYNELLEYLNQDDDLTIDEVKEFKNVKELSNGLIIYVS